MRWPYLDRPHLQCCNFILIAVSSQPPRKAETQAAVLRAAMGASPMAKYTAELHGIRAVLVQAQASQLELEAKLKEVSAL